MPKDIRSYFTKSPASQKPANSVRPKIKKKPVISDDEDDEVSIKEKPASKKSPKRQGKHVLSDSDEDVPAKKLNSSGKLTSKQKQPEIKEVSVTDVLGKTPVKRVNAPKASRKKDMKEADFHDDEDFEATLNAIDPAEIEAKYFKEEGGQGSGKRKKNHSSDDNVTPKKPKLEAEKKEDIKKKQKSVEKDKEKKQKSSEKNKETKSDEEKSKLTFSNLAKFKSKNLEIDVTEKKASAKKSSDDGDFLEERAMKKKQTSALYQQYLSRGGARDPGSKPIPEGAPNCLAGLSFVLTGVFVSLEREEAAELVQKYGGRVTQSVSKKIDYVVVGEEAGQSKINKANDLKLKQISEDDLLDLIRNRPAGNSRNIILNKSRKKEPSPKKSPERRVSPKKSPKKEDVDPTIEVKRSTSPKPSSSLAGSDSDNAEALVEKYRPRMMKQIIGQHGDKSNAKKLHLWLSNWYKNRKTKTTKPSPWAKSDDGAFFKACLLSGPPGVGKTTTAQVVCNELGFDLLEFNASDTRSKRLLKEEVSGLLSNTTMKGYFSDNNEKPTSKHVLLMDEVDGMAGNEDRGGLQELISLIKSTDIPIICICNDRNNPKMRTLANYVFDLKFQKPRIEQIRGAMKSLCCKESIKISNEDLDRLIESTNQDIRQVINHLAMLIGDPVDNKKEQSSKLNKDLKLGPWDVVRKVFSAEEHKHMTIHDKSDLFFHDYSIAGLFVQENYLSVNPKVPKSEVLERVAASADSLSLGDQVEKAIRSNNAWSLLPMQACYASVIPGTLMSGNITGQIQFPAWLGKNSRRGKFDRLLQEITVHTRLVTGASKEAINIDYLKPLRDAVTRPLVVDGSEGVDSAINVMNHYHLLREDLDSLVEVSLWPGDRDPMQAVETKVKAAFTRNYNKNSAPAPFVVNATVSKKKGGGGATQDEGFIDDEENEEDEEEDDESIDADKMVKKSAAKAHQLLVEAYGEGALSERTCREWFQKFKNGDFDVEDKDRSGRPKIYEDAELKELLEEDSSQTQKELALTLEVTQQAVSHRLKSLGMIHEQGNWAKKTSTTKATASTSKTQAKPASKRGRGRGK